MKYTHRIITTDRRQIALTSQQATELDMAMQERRPFFRLDQDNLINVLKDIARVEKIPAQDLRPERTLPQPDRMSADGTGPGYKKFMEMKKTLLAKKRMGES
jgi:hypothetical protein